MLGCVSHPLRIWPYESAKRIGAREGTPYAMDPSTEHCIPGIHLEVLLIVERRSKMAALERCSVDAEYSMDSVMSR